MTSIEGYLLALAESAYILGRRYYKMQQEEIYNDKRINL